MALPGDPVMLLSVVNLKLRDQYPTLDALCDDLDADKAALCAKLAAAGYDVAVNYRGSAAGAEETGLPITASVGSSTWPQEHTGFASRENIRRIRIMLGDLETSAVARSKIAKRKVAASA